MIATSVFYDLVVVVHILAALATIVVFFTMRLDALAVARGAHAESQATRFPDRRNVAARALHVLPVTGFIMVSSGGPSVAFSRPWVAVGLLCYLAAAGHLEWRTLPAERALASSIARDGVASPSAGRRLVVSVDVLLLILAAALVTMFWQY